MEMWPLCPGMSEYLMAPVARVSPHCPTARAAAASAVLLQAHTGAGGCAEEFPNQTVSSINRVCALFAFLIIIEI